MKKVLLFGAGGFAGGHMANELLRCGYEVYGCSRYSKLSDERFSGSYVCDILDADRVKTVISEIGPDYIVNLAGISSVGLSWKIPQKTVEINTVGPLNILENVKEIVPDAHVLFIGSSEEYAPTDDKLTEDKELDANNPYGISKIMLERYCNLYREHYGIKVHYVRAFNHTGPGQADSFVIPSWCKQAAEISNSGEQGIMHVGNLDVARDFSDVRDVVTAYRLILESDDCSKIYNVCSGKATYLKDILNTIISLSKQHIDIQVSDKLIRPVENDTICGSHEMITKELGWKPQIDIKDTIIELFEYYEKRKNNRV